MMKFLAILIVQTFLLVSNIESIIRNDITNRCLHLGFLKRKDATESVYATTCSWNGVDGRNGHQDEWLEIVSSLHQQKYFIRKVANESDSCLATISDNQPGVSSHCDAPDASFSLDMVYQKNFKGLLTSPTTFKIRNAAGYCLTVQPGQPFLKFKDCSPRQGLFQVWSVCRHNKKCDVDLTWSPRDIIFPKNSTDVDYVLDITAENGGPQDDVKATTNTPMQQNVKKEAPEDSVTNEVLYTVQNAVRIYASSEQFLRNGIGAFYTKESLSEARELLLKMCDEDSLKCSMCTMCESDHSSPNVTVAWLLKWMEACNTYPTLKTFLSRDVFQVPHHLFPSHDPTYLKELPVKEKYKQIIPNLRKYLKELEASLHEHEHQMDTDEIKPLEQNKVNQSTTESLTQSEKESDSDREHGQVDKIASVPASVQNDTQDYLSIIDIRLTKPKNG